jgi:GNAT acetyltransferase-like protein
MTSRILSSNALGSSSAWDTSRPPELASNSLRSEPPHEYTQFTVQQSDAKQPMINLLDKTLGQNSPLENYLSPRDVGPALRNVYEVDPLRDHRWPSFLQRRPQASVFHSVGWLEALHRTYGYEPVVFTTSPPTSDLENGMLFCRVRSWATGSRSVSLSFSDHCEPLCDLDREFDSLIRGPQIARARHQWKYLEIRPVDQGFGDRAKALGFKSLAKYLVHVIDLRPTAQVIFRRLHKDSVQRRVRRAERAGIVEICGKSQEHLKNFYRLMVRTRARHNLPPQPYHWFRNLLDCLGDAADLRLAYRDSVPVAGVLVLHFKGTSYYKYGCSDERAHCLGVMPFLLWRAVLHAKLIGSTSFDLGRTGIDNHSLIAFKNRWTSISQPLTYWTFPSDRSLTLMKDWKLTMVKCLCALLPDWMLEAAGRLTYRHTG